MINLLAKSCKEFLKVKYLILNTSDGITTIGGGVYVEPEIHLRNVVVLPFRNVSESSFHQIIV